MLRSRTRTNTRGKFDMILPVSRAAIGALTDRQAVVCWTCGVRAVPDLPPGMFTLIHSQAVGELDYGRMEFLDRIVPHCLKELGIVPKEAGFLMVTSKIITFDETRLLYDGQLLKCSREDGSGHDPNTNWKLLDEWHLALGDTDEEIDEVLRRCRPHVRYHYDPPLEVQ